MLRTSWEGRKLLITAILHYSITSYMYSRALSRITLLYIASSLPTILDSLLLYHKHSHRGEGWGGGKLQSGKLQLVSNWNTAKWCINWGCFKLHTSQNVAKSVASNTRQQYAWWFPVDCLPVQARWSHLKTTQAIIHIWKVWESSQSKSRVVNCWQS